ncbi:MAG: hypothetical protein HOB12_15660 [Gemmatimonadales bacterium]|nr:hypothetical protein [Gemmatimonadales bacterium]
MGVDSAERLASAGGYRGGGVDVGFHAPALHLAGSAPDEALADLAQLGPRPRIVGLGVPGSARAPVDEELLPLICNGFKD